MPNITISVPEEIYEEMKLRKEIKWSEIIRRAIIEYLKKLKRERMDAIEVEVLREEFRDLLSKIKDVDVRVEELREMEMKRLESS